MDLYINTSKKDKLFVALKKGSEEIDSLEMASERQQAELLLPSVERLLKKNKLGLSDLDRIIVEPAGESFMALRIGIATANALGFALGIPVVTPEQGGQKAQDKRLLVRPHYDREPNITLSKKLEVRS